MLLCLTAQLRHLLKQETTGREGKTQCVFTILEKSLENVSGCPLFGCAI